MIKKKVLHSVSIIALRTSHSTDCMHLESLQKILNISLIKFQNLSRITSIPIDSTKGYSCYFCFRRPLRIYSEDSEIYNQNLKEMSVKYSSDSTQEKGNYSHSRQFAECARTACTDGLEETVYSFVKKVYEILEVQQSTYFRHHASETL